MAAESKPLAITVLLKDKSLQLVEKKGWKHDVIDKC